MITRDLVYSDLKEIAQKSNIEKFDSIHCGRGIDAGELCIEYDNDEGYILFSYDRDCETYHYATKDYEEFKYSVFLKLCSYNGHSYELRHRKRKSSILSLFRDKELEEDTRKIAFEYTLEELNRLNHLWLKKAIPIYEELLNKWRMNKNVYFDLKHMKFIVKKD